MRVALFGGSFNPPHVGHQLAALYVLETSAVDELWWVPTFLHPFDKPLERFEDRFAMCERAAEALGPRARVSDVEARLGGPSRTLRTVEALIAANPGVAFSLVIGSDLVAEAPSWYGAEALVRLVPFLVVGRMPRARSTAPAAPAGSSATASPAAISGVAAPVAMPDVSSTAIRAALKDGRAPTAWVPRRVLDYIAERRLYGVAPID